MRRDPLTAHVLYTADDAYAQMLGISLISLYENSRDMKEIVVYVLDGGITKENRGRIEEISRGWGRRAPVWMAAADISSELGIEVGTNQRGKIQFARIFLPLFKETDRILYLDCDLIVRKSIKELWNTDLEGKTVGVVMDAMSRSYRRNLGLSPDAPIFNAGVILIDLEKWESREVKRRTLDVIRKHHGKVVMGDQGALSAALGDDLKVLSPGWNALTIFYDFSYREMMRYRRPPEYYSEPEVISAAKDPAIVHFTFSFLSQRPWEKGCAHPFAKEWKSYRSKSPWKDVPPVRPRKSLPNRLLLTLPRRIMLFLAGLLYRYGRPFVWWLAGYR